MKNFIIKTIFRLLLILKVILQIKFKFFPPPQKRILIYDKGYSHFLLNFFNKKDCEIFCNRWEEINIFILCIAILKKKKEKLSTTYVHQYIKRVKPKIIITYTDNRPSYYLLKSFFKDICIISIQNGIRGYGCFFDTEEKRNNLKNKNLAVDYMFVMSGDSKKIYSQFLKGQIICSGSIINNLTPIIKKTNLIKKKKKILFISQYRVRNYEHLHYFQEIGKKMYGIDDFFKSEHFLIPEIVSYCKKNEITLEICGSTNIKSEYKFYKSLIKDEFKSWQFFPRKNIQTTYNMLDEATAVAFIDSTLGYEALSRKRPTACFSIRGETFDNFDGCKFGRPAIYQDAGPFWCNYLNISNLNNILDFVLNVSDENWRKIKDKYANELMAYDKENIKFKNIMKNLNIPLVNEN